MIGWTCACKLRCCQQCASARRSSHLLKLRELVHKTVHELAGILQANELAEFRRTKVEVTIPRLGC